MTPLQVAVLVLGVALLAVGVVVAVSAGRSRPDDRAFHEHDGYDDWTGYGPTPTRSGGRGGLVAGITLEVVGALVLAIGGAWLVTSHHDSGPEAADASTQAAGTVTSTGAGTTTEDAGRQQASQTSTPQDAPAQDSPRATGTAQPRATSGGPSTVPGDLGLSVPMTRPACDGRGIVVFQSAVTPGNYEAEVAAALAAYPGTSYLRTDQSCPSLRQRDENGNVIYAVYRPSGYDRSQLCADVGRVQVTAAPAAYGRWLDTTSDPTQIVAC